MDFSVLCNDCVKTVRANAPIRTGNLRYNAVRYENRDADTFVIYVDYYDAKTHNGIGWYMPYTNEPWISPKWNGKPNPNQGWWQNAVREVAETVAAAIGGEIKK